MSVSNDAWGKLVEPDAAALPFPHETDYDLVAIGADPQEAQMQALRRRAERAEAELGKAGRVIECSACGHGDNYGSV